MTTTVPTRMSAVVQHRYGDDLAPLLQHVDDVATPSPGPGQVLVRLDAAGVDRGTWHLATGKPYLARLAFGVRRPRLAVPGHDLAGTVVGVGEGVTAWRPGDAVLGTGRGTYAELALADADVVVARPAGLPAAEAAAMPDSGSTAWQALHQHARVATGDRVLVIGASGGVGSYAVALAAAVGAEVTAVCSAAKADHVRRLGATEVIDRHAEEVDARGRHDVVLDLAGNRPLRVLRRALTPRGRLVIVGGEDAGPMLFGLPRQGWAAAVGRVTGQRMRGMLSRPSQETLTALVTAHVAGRLDGVVTRHYPLAQAGEALDDLAAGRITGKAVLLP